MTQEDKILADLKAGKVISPLDAAHKYGSLRLGARIFDLKRKGYKIGSRPLKTPTGKYVAEYYLEQEEAVRHSNLTEETRINLEAVRR